MVKSKKINKKQPPMNSKLAQLLEELKQPKKTTIEDTMSAAQKMRLKPLAWLIKNQDYSLQEVMITALAYQEQKHTPDTKQRAENILSLIRQRAKEGKNDSK